MKQLLCLLAVLSTPSVFAGEITCNFASTGFANPIALELKSRIADDQSPATSAGMGLEGNSLKQEMVLDGVEGTFYFMLISYYFPKNQKAPYEMSVDAAFYAKSDFDLFRYSKIYVGNIRSLPLNTHSFQVEGMGGTVTCNVVF